jgi:hypothetical protein
MATKLKTFDWTSPSTLTTSEKATYPWEEWFDGDIWQLTRDEDFDGHPLMMERIIRTRATGRKAKVRLRHVPLNGEQWGIIVVQRTDIAGPNEAKRSAANEKRAATRAAKNGTAEVTDIDTKRKPKVGKAPAVKTIAKPNGVVTKRVSKKVAAKV